MTASGEIRAKGSKERESQMETSKAARLALVQKLVNLSRGEWKYADLYLDDAERLLSPLLTREQFQGLVHQRNLIPKLAADMRRAVQSANWQKAEQLARQGTETRKRIQRDAPLVSLAEDVFGEKVLSPSSTALALPRAVSQTSSTLGRDLSLLQSQLRELAAAETEYQTTYQRRADELEHLRLDDEVGRSQQVDPVELRQAAIRAADDGDFAAVLQLCQRAARSRQDRLGRVRAPRPASGWVARLAKPIPEAAVELGRRLGLEVASLEPQDKLNAYLSGCCAERPVLPSAALTEKQRELQDCTCGHVCPPDVRESLQSSLDALMIHPFVTSGGTRYLPWFGAETILVESFPEDQPDLPTALLSALSLPCRRGLPRLVVENALLSKGPMICANLGLQPAEFRVTCIPFDAYERLADRFRWGRQQLWTHFDGYQVTRDLNFQALIGGDVRYGGPDDLCCVSRSYDSEHITVRFAVIRRDRFEARESRSEEA
jgi:hypothetical protein